MNTTKIPVITDDKSHALAMSELKSFLKGKDEDCLSADELAYIHAMGLIIEDYEKKRWPVGPVDPLEFIKFMMEQNNFKVVDIAPCFGTPARTYEVLNKKRKLTLSMVKKLKKTFKCSADAFV